MGQLLSDTSNNEDNGDLVSSATKYFMEIKAETKIISQETIHLIEFHLKKGNIQGANSVINDALKNIDNAPINVAVTGESGAGKSSFINALRGVEPEDQDAAEEGVTETTMMRTPYKHPKIKTLTLWDLPGIGTMNFPPKDYLEKVKFQEHLSDYDFPILMDTLIKDLSNQKRHNFMLSLPNITEAVIDRKHKSLQQHIWLEAFTAGLLAAIPGVGIHTNDVEKLKVKLNHYRVLFGVDDASLDVIAKDSQVPIEQLRKIIKSPYLLETKKEETLGEMLFKYLEKFHLANGGLLAADFYFRKTFYLEFLFLDTVTEDAKVLLRETYSKI
ncbi:Interferon-inducible GTPase 1 [Microtus ochrogaster]|uniref:Interferon-inducible GTPase 1 n=1 Tax=Microtus ochrogaster TaxID=79684 RepID=A0A8J6KVG7_MICOH|nr:Interferon-inducible GTPase 1 [Microtus ochrogaster]